MATIAADGGPRIGLVWPAPQWLALFYDLAFSSGIIAISSSYGYDHSALGALWFTVAYGIIASAWILTGAATGAFAPHTRPVGTRMIVLIVAQMAAILMLAVASGDTIAASEGLFDVLLAVILATCLALGWLARGGAAAMPPRSQSLIAAAILTIGAAWILPGSFGIAAWLLALVALAFAAGIVAVDRRIDVHRLAHRLGELTIIIIGEILVKLVLTAKAESLWAVQLLSFGAALVLLVATFWAYFTRPVVAVRLVGRRRLAWVSAHWALHVGLLGLAAGLGKLLVDAAPLAEPGAVAALLTGPAVVIMASLTTLDWLVGLGRWRIMLVATGVVALLAVVSSLAEMTPVEAAYGVGIVPLIALAIANRGPRRED